MYRDKRIIVEAYLERLEIAILLYVDVLSFHWHKTKQGYDISAWGSPQKSMQDQQDIRNVIILTAIK